jgi:tRNA threonylcarbamoyladenosine biosynthesis protein TsaE
MHGAGFSTVRGADFVRGQDVRVLSHSESETREVGARLATVLQPGDVVALYGELGAGKTRLIQGICRGLGVREEVTSPSFVLINEYRGRIPVYHFDFYRLERLEEIAGLGIEEYFDGSGVCLIEWADRAEPLLPPERIEVVISLIPAPGEETEREIEVRWKRPAR